jgi:hypothetical protein
MFFFVIFIFGVFYIIYSLQIYSEFPIWKVRSTDQVRWMNVVVETLDFYVVICKTMCVLHGLGHTV